MYAERGDLFEGLSIWQESAYRNLQGTYPVIFLSFADIKATTFKTARGELIHKLVSLYSAFAPIKSTSALNEKDLAYFDSISTDMTDDVAAVSINHLAEYLRRYYGKKSSSY